MTKILIPLVVNPAWLGGIQYIRNLIRALDRLPRNDLPEIWLRVLAKENANQYEREFRQYPWLRMDGPRLSLGRRLRTRLFGKPDNSSGQSWAAGAVDVVFPVKYASFLPGPHERIFWIPDFQYKNIPGYFSEKERAQRDSAYNEIYALKPMLVLSSENVRRDFEQYFPEAAATTQVEILRFTSVFSSDELSPEPDEVVRRYGLPDRYVYMPNQFFVHKRHDVAFEALARLRRQKLRIPLVCTGHCADFRDPTYFTKLQRFIDDQGLAEQIRILGVISRRDQIQIYRGASLVLQPSMSEGWSTSIEDARALGKPTLLSDIKVHFEQAPPMAEYFIGGNAGALAGRLAECWESRRKEHPQAYEANTIAEQDELVRNYARNALRIFENAFRRSKSK